MTQGILSVYILLSSLLLFLIAYNFVKVRGIMMAAGFYLVMTGVFATYSNWLPQSRGEVPPPPKVLTGIDSMPVDKLADLGEEIIFGKVGGFAEGGKGKGQCPLCHSFKAGDLGERAPNLIGIAERAGKRVKEDRYKKADTVQNESFEGSGRATTAQEYIAESHACPSCYVVVGFGEQGTNDRSSPMPVIHKGAISLTIDELIAVDTWLYFREGEEPPSASEIRFAYEKFIPESERKEGPAEGGGKPAAAGPPIAMYDDTPEEMVKKMGCAACHQIPGISFAKAGALGPVLIEKTNAPRRLVSPEYKARVQAGKAGARSQREYVRESILRPSAYVVKEFELGNPEKSLMLPDFEKKFTVGGLEKLIDYLLNQDCAAAKRDGLVGPPFEPVAKICS